MNQPGPTQSLHFCSIHTSVNESVRTKNSDYTTAVFAVVQMNQPGTSAVMTPAVFTGVGMSQPSAWSSTVMIPRQSVFTGVQINQPQLVVIHESC